MGTVGVSGKLEKQLKKKQKNTRLQSRTYFFVKRVFDLVFASVMLVALSPLLLLVTVLIRLTSKGPAIYKHRRVGLYGKPIDVLKFRSMIENADTMTSSFDDERQIEWNENFKVQDDPRVTKLGLFLRKSSLDELPQLINILRGDMTLIGPRPITAEELERYGEDAERFVSVLPGLTGYWQAYARNDCSYEQRMKMELHYIKNANILWDIQIFFATFIRVATGKGAS